MSKPVRISERLHALVEQVAEVERRSVANTVAILLEEALAARGQSGDAAHRVHVPDEGQTRKDPHPFRASEDQPSDATHSVHVPEGQSGKAPHTPGPNASATQRTSADEVQPMFKTKTQKGRRR